MLSDNHRRYWRKNLIAIALLLALGFAVTFGVPFFARALSFGFLGWPFSFWMGAQGALLVYCLIVGVYAWYMNRLDIEHGVADGDD
jgi:putative solute:sodium symporter small subunit